MLDMYTYADGITFQVLVHLLSHFERMPNNPHHTYAKVISVFDI